MKRMVNATRRATTAAAVSAALLLAQRALAYQSPAHEFTAFNNLLSFDLARHKDFVAPNVATTYVCRDSPNPFFPELAVTSRSWVEGKEPGTVDLTDATNATIAGWNSSSPDQFESFDWGAMGCVGPELVPDAWDSSLPHFWDPDIGGAYGMVGGPLRPNIETWSGVPELCPGIDTSDPLSAMLSAIANSDLYPSAWIKAKTHWLVALTFWRAEFADETTRKLQHGEAYAHLGQALHMLLDQSQPAHTHEDMHNGSDSLEEWFNPSGNDFQRTLYTWFAPGYPPEGGAGQAMVLDGGLGVPAPPGTFPVKGDLLYPPDNADACNVLLTTRFWSAGARYKDDLEGAEAMIGNDPDLIADCAAGGPNKLGELFYLFYVVNQIAQYYPSDEADGNRDEPTGWLRNYAGFPAVDHSSSGLEDSYARLEQILTGQWHEERVYQGNAGGHYGAYQAGFLATHSLIDLFRRTIDGEPPVTIFSAVRRDGEPASRTTWNNSPVTVTVLRAEEFGRAGYRPSGVAKVLARYGEQPFETDLGQGDSISLYDGQHVIQGLSYDMTGAVDRRDLHIDVDATPPTIQFPDLKPVYLTSEKFLATWTAVDALSGTESSWAFLDDEVIVYEQVVDLALLAGFHTLKVYARDLAGNEGWREFAFEVLIDAQAWTRPREVNERNTGSFMCYLEFPVAYDVGLVDLSTTTLTVNGVALTPFGMTHPADGDRDGRPDRMLRFDAAAFMSAAGAVVPGEVPATLAGRLAGGELTPGFVTTCVVPVFAPGT